MYSTSFGTLNITDYDKALSKWEGIKPIRGRSDQNSRPLYRRGDDSKTIRQLSNGGIALRLWHTDVVTFNTDGTLDLEPYASVSTCAFVRAVLGWGSGVHAHWSDRSHPLPDNVTQVGGHYYHTPQFATLGKVDGSWSLLGGSEPFELTSLDKKLTKAALEETGYNQFKVWLTTQIRIGLDPRQGDRWRSTPYDWSHREVSQYLTSGPEGWGELVRRMSKRCEIDRELETLRRAVYKCAGAATETAVPYFENYKAMTNAFAAMRKYG